MSKHQTFDGPQYSTKAPCLLDVVMNADGQWVYPDHPSVASRFTEEPQEVADPISEAERLGEGLEPTSGEAVS
ncbi:MAG: hypothetical protein AAFO83_00035 [Cyanobacteria bacterium J06607_13]